MITSAQFDKTIIGKDQEHLFRGLAECSGVPESLCFGDGLTLVVGPNGSGKSLLLAALAAGCAAIYGRPEISKRALSDFFLFRNTSKIEGITVCHDGQVLYAEPTLNFFERNTDAYLASAIRRSQKSMSRGEFVLQSLHDVMQLLAQAAKKEMFFDLEAEVSKTVAKRKNKPNEKELNKIKQNVLEKFEKKGMFPAIAFPRAVDALAGQEVAEAWRENGAQPQGNLFLKQPLDRVHQGAFVAKNYLDAPFPIEERKRRASLW